VSAGFIENIVESISFRVFIKVLNDVEYFVHIGSDRRVLIVASIPCMLLKLAWRLREFSMSVDKAVVIVFAVEMVIQFIDEHISGY